MLVGEWVQHSDVMIWHMKYQFLLKFYLILRKRIISFITLNKSKPETSKPESIKPLIH